MTMARTVAAVEQGGRWAKGIVSPTGRNAEAVEKGAKYRAEIRRISKLPRDQRQAALRALSQIN
jgi:predicted aminopeptidase